MAGSTRPRVSSVARTGSWSFSAWSGRERGERILQQLVQRGGAGRPAVRRGQHLDVSPRVEAEPGRDLAHHHVHGEPGDLLGVGAEQEEVAQAVGVGAATIGLGLAAGVTLGQYLGRPVGRKWDRYDERVRQPAMTTD